MSTYSIFGVEEVYDAFDEYEHANPLPPFSVHADSVDEAKKKGSEAIFYYIKLAREGFWSSGDFVPRVIQIADESGHLVFDDPDQLVRVWPFASDERSLIPKEGFPTRVCFITYSSRDEDFARGLYKKLFKRRYMIWFAPERPDMPKRRFENEQLIRTKIAEGIFSARVVLVVISEHSITSSWVAFEASTAIEGECLHNRPTIFGLQIEHITSEVPWLSELRTRYVILDFLRWHNNACFEKQINHLATEMNSVFKGKSQ